MQQCRKSAFVIMAFLLFIACFDDGRAKSPVVVGMVTETQGHAYWQNDTKKNRVQELAELPVNAKMVLIKGSKLTVVYLTSGQQYELNGPALVQFKNAKPVALSGTTPKTIGAAPVLTEKKRIDPKSVQTAGQTLVSTEAKADPNLPVAVAAAPPPLPPAPVPAPALPRMTAPSAAPAPAARPDTLAAIQARKRMEAAEAAAKRSVEAEMMATRQAEMAAQQAKTAESASQIAEREAAKAAAAKAVEKYVEKKTAEPKPEPECPPPTSDDATGLTEVAACSDIED